MFLKNKKLIGLVALASFSQFACYNTYTIDKTELEKLEAEVEPKEVVTVYGDCAGATAYRSVDLQGSMWAQADVEAEAEASDATAAGPKAASKPADAGRPGCTSVPVSTANPVTVVTKEGDEYRVTPFNFIMSGQQLVSPEYDLLLPLQDVEGAEVRQFSTWKTVGTIVGVSAVAIGTFVGISVLAPDSAGFQNE